jgi:plasmid stabilization system protein ParE
MAYRIIWTNHARRTYRELIRGFLEEDQQSKAEKLIHRVEDILALLKDFPEMFPLLDGYPMVHKVVLTDHVSFCYRFKGAYVEMIHFWPNRSNPKRLKAFLDRIRESH